MAIAAEMSLPHLPIDTVEFSPDPDLYLERARREHPWLARFSQGYVVHGYKAATDLLADDANLVQGMGPLVDFYRARDTMWGRYMTELVVSATGSTHSRLRASVGRAFTPRSANQARPLMRKVISGLLDEWAPKGAFNFPEFASFFPVTVMCGLLGVSAEPVSRLRTAIEDHTSSLIMDLATKPKFLAAWDVLWGFVDRLVSEREASGTYDEDALLDALIDAKKSGQLDEIELRFMVLTVIIGAYDTTKNQLTMLMMILLDRPQVYERCADDVDYCAKVVAEGFRHSSVAMPYRQALRPFSYDGCEFREGEVLTFIPPLAGRDPTVFPDPARFDPERENANRHLAFGRGAHICMGMFIARTELQEGLHLIAQRVRNPRLDGPIIWRSFLGAWSPSSLPIAFDRA